MAPAKRDAVLKEVTNAPDVPRDTHDAADAPGIFKQRPNTVQTFSRRKRLDQVPLVTVSMCCCCFTVPQRHFCGFGACNLM